MKAFIEVDAETTQRPLYNEQTLEYIKTKTVYKPYPYAYGFLLNTISGDGDHLDCYVITSQSLTSGSIIDVEPIGMVESIENGVEDHKILCCLPGEKITIDSVIEHKIREFGEHYFDNRPDKHLVIGRFLGYKDAIKLIDSCKNMKSKFKETMKKWIPYRKMDELIKVTFYFSDISGNDYEIIEDILKKHGSFFTAGVHTGKRIAYADFYKDQLNLDHTFIDLKNAGLSIIPEKTQVEPSTEHELNCISIIVLAIIIYILTKIVL